LICEGGRVEVIPDKDTSIILNDKTDLVETNLKDIISPKKSKNEGDDDLFENSEVIFKLKKWNHVCLWQWDVDNDVCAICRIVILEPCLNCQTCANGPEDCSVVWGVCNHTFHNCCLGRWLVQTNRCPLCQQEWVVQRIGK
jgi:RING-box protein 2